MSGQTGHWMSPPVLNRSASCFFAAMPSWQWRSSECSPDCSKWCPSLPHQAAQPNCPIYSAVPHTCPPRVVDAPVLSARACVRRACVAGLQHGGQQSNGADVARFHHERRWRSRAS
eukprot:3177663-Amphidinium_carterae.1